MLRYLEAARPPLFRFCGVRSELPLLQVPYGKSKVSIHFLPCRSSLAPSSLPFYCTENGVSTCISKIDLSKTEILCSPLHYF